MKSNELRIGNLVSYSSEDNTEILPIDCIQSDNTVRLLKSGQSIGCFYADSIEPILLTPEILEKAGFKKTKSNDYLKLITEDGWRLCINETDDFDIWYGKEEFWGDRLPLCSIKFLHQLQNLYFALTGEELPIEL